VKCPKCHYLGFETGDRCRNCGYDFSLLSVAEAEPADYEIHATPVDDVPVRTVEHIAQEDEDPWLGLPEEPLDADDEPVMAIRSVPPLDEPRLELAIGLVEGDATAEAVSDLPLTPPALAEAPLVSQTFAETPVDISPPPKPIAPFLSAASVRSPATSGDRVLPLFKRAQEDDEPLIKMPAAPRPPLAVRRTPEPPRLRAVLRPVARPASPPALQFAEDTAERTAASPHERRALAESLRPVTPVVESSRPIARIAAALIDALILLGIDAAVVYFTVRMAGLSMDEWTSLPVAPMATFLGLLTLSYLGAFTAVGGQTIGKMALGTCVVDECGKPVDPDRALRRTSATVLSCVLFGLGFVPALFGDHRALHDRLTGTRVVRLRSV
jgi:uncharacterized RDD family membrane protein YckC